MNKKIKQQLKSEFKVSIDNLTEKVKAIQGTVEELKKCGLNEDILYFAIQRSSQKFNTHYKPILISDIKAIVSGIGALEKYMFPEDESKE